MANYTNNLNLEKQNGNEYVSIEAINNNFNTIDKAISDFDAKTAGGTAAALTLTIDTIRSYRPGMKITIIASKNSSSSNITLKINNLATLPVYKPNTTEAPKIIAGKPYTFILSQDQSYFFLDASAEGNAVAEHVLAGDFFSNETDSNIPGIMPNNGSIGTQTLTNEGAEYTIPAGYHNGLGKVKAAITGLIASVIKAGTTVGGILGAFTSDATATASQILSGVTAYVNGSKVTGTIVSKAAATYTPGTTDQTIAAGQYLSGAQTIKGDANLLTSNVLKGKTIFGVPGKASVVDTADANAVAADISSGKTGYVNGNKVTGTLVATKYATGTVLANSTPSNATLQDGTVINAYQAAVSGLSFLPKNIVAFAMYGTEEYGVSYNQHGPAVSSKVFNSYRAPASGPGAAYKLHSTVNPFIVTETGFVLPVLQGGITYTWYAYE
ncbi:MAG: hypothetical protein K0R00_888 [Herbinix sp.]|jgi:hypothetical protein|nr:hypothetical protein [Herbinix sp.]